MQCPKCKYEPTMAEMQRSSDSCPKCQIVYSNFGKGQEASKGAVNQRKSAGVLARLALACIVVAALFGGWKFYDYRQTVAAVEEQVRLTSAYVNQVVTALDDSGSMTFAEFFEKANKAVSEIDAAMVRLSVISPASDVSAASVIYMKKSQEVIRALAGSMRSMMKLSSAKDRLEKAEQDQYSSNEYIQERAVKTKLEALNEQIEILDSLKGSRENMAKLLAELKATGEAIPGIEESSLVPPPLYERLSSLNKK